MKKGQKSQLTRYILATLTVGMFGIVPVAQALPVQDTGYTNTTGSAINTSVANQMGITSTVANNVMNWQSFSIAKGEKVAFDSKNYLNLVRGTSKSEINGILSGTGNGSIYLINPNGILFGSTAQVNVGNLVASTRAITDADQTTFLAGNNPITTNTASTAAGDIINLGKLQTASVLLEGNNITIQNAADITSNGTVTAKAAGIITVGHAVTATTTRSFTINGTPTDKTVHDYAKATVAASGYTATDLAGTQKSVTESMLVDNVYDLQNMDAKVDGSYMLSGNIDASETSSWNTGAGFSPVGNDTTMFSGTFDGLNHTINGLYINRSETDYVGLFGYVKGGTIQNVGLVCGSLTGRDNVGGVVGMILNGIITNVYNTGAVSGTSSVGGVAGVKDSGKIENAYNTGAVSGTSYVGGVAGESRHSGIIKDVYNTGAVSGTSSVGGVVGINAGTVENAYNTGAVRGQDRAGGVAGYNLSGITNAYNTGAVSGTGDYVGGVVGYNYSGSIVKNAYNTGAVSGASYVGGVAGWNYNNGTITNVYNTGAVSGTGDYVGGVAGYNYGSITNVYNTGAVSAQDSAGGVVGVNDGTVTNAYNTGAVSGQDSAGGVVGVNGGPVTNAYNTGAVSGQNSAGGVAGVNLSGIENAYNTGAVSGNSENVGGVAGDNSGTVTNALWANDLDYKPTTGRKPTKAVGNAEDTDTVKGVSLADMKKAATYDSWTDAENNKIVASEVNKGTVWRIYEGNTAPLLTSFFKSVVTVTGLDSKATAYNGTTQTADISRAVYSPADIDTSHIWAGSGRNAGTYSAIYSDQQGYDLKNANTLTITPKTLKATLTGKTGDTYVFTKTYDGTTSVTKNLVLGDTYTFDNAVSGDTVSIAANNTGVYTDNKNVANDKTIKFTGITLTGADAGNYTIADTLSGDVGQITPKTLTATLTGDNVFTKVYDGTTTVSQTLTQGTNYTLDGIVADSDKVSLTAGSGAYNDKNAGDNKTITFSGLTLTGEGAGNYTIASNLSGAVGQITRRTITGSLASGYSFDKVYDGTTTAYLGNGYTLNGVVAGDTVPLTAANGFYDSSAMGDRTVTFSGFSINDGNYLLSMADSLSGKGKITTSSQDHNYSDALAGVSSFFGANPSGGYTIFSGAPGDYVARAANGQTRYSTGEAQAAPAGATQESLTWYNGPLTLTIVNGGITLPKDILLGSTYDTRTVVIKGSDSYQI